MRLFLALEINNLNFDLKKLKVNLNKAKNLEHKWIPEHFWHIPLLSLGELGREHFLNLSSSIDSIVNTHSAFDLKLEGVWAYPRQDHARVLWIGVQNSKELRQLQSMLSEKLAVSESSDEDEKPFKPHLPIVRLRNYREVSDLISPFKNRDFGKVAIENVVAYEMTSGGAFPTYRKVAEFRLGRGDYSELTVHP